MLLYVWLQTCSELALVSTASFTAMCQPSAPSCTETREVWGLLLTTQTIPLSKTTSSKLAFGSNRKTQKKKLCQTGFQSRSMPSAIQFRWQQTTEPSGLIIQTRVILCSQQLTSTRWCCRLSWQTFQHHPFKECRAWFCALETTLTNLTSVSKALR